MNKQPKQHSHDPQFSTPFPRPVRALSAALT